MTIFSKNICITNLINIPKGKRLITNFLFIIVAIAVVLRIYHLDFYSLWNDEMYFLDLSKKATLFGTAEFFHLSFAPLLIKYFTNFLGTSDFVIRLPFAIFSILSVIMIYLLGKLMFNRRIGLIASFLLAISVYAIGEAHDAKLYSLVTFFPMAALFFLYKIFNQEYKRKYLILFLLSVFFTLYAGFIGIIPVTAIFIYGFFLLLPKVLVFNNNSVRLKYPRETIIFLIASLGIFAVMYFGFLERMLSGNTFNLKITPLNVIFNKERIDKVNAIIHEFSNNKLYLYFFVWAFFYPFFFRKRLKSWLFLLLYPLMLFVYFFVFTIKFDLKNQPGGFPIYLARYYIPFLPVYLLTVSLGIFSSSVLISRILNKIKLLSKLNLTANKVMVIITFIFLIVSLPLLYDYYFIPQGFRADWRGTGKYLSSHTSPGDVLVRGIREQQDLNYIGTYFNFVTYGIDYSIFPVKEKKNNWYVTNEFEFPNFEDWTVSSSVHPTYRSYPMRIFNLSYIGQGNETVKITDKSQWSITYNNDGTNLNFLADDHNSFPWISRSTISTGDFLQIDMGSNKVITDIYLNSPRPSNIKDYIIETSLDANNWQIVNRTYTSHDPLFYYTPLIPMKPSKARYLRIESLADHWENWVIYWIDIYEVKNREVNSLYNRPNKFTGLVVSDPAATLGYAKFVPKYDPAELKIFQYGERFILPKGQYQAKFRVKTDDNNEIKEDYPNITSLMIDIAFEKVGEYLPNPIKIKPTDFPQVNKYRDFYLLFNHDGEGHIVFRIRDYGKNNYWFDYPTIEEYNNEN